MITWRVSQGPGDHAGEGVTNNTRDAWSAALSLAVRTAQLSHGIDPLDIAVGDNHARLYPGYDHAGRYDQAGTSRIAADLLAAVTDDTGTDDTGTDDTPFDQTPRSDVPRSGRQACGIPRPACPQHGNTISSSGGRSWCRTCGRTWNTSDIEPCPEPVTHLVTDTAGTAVSTCDGHTEAARTELAGAKIESFPG